MTRIDYYFTQISPWAYLGHSAFLDIAARHGAEIGWKPVMLAKVFENSGGQPLAQRPKARQDYRFVELQRWRARRGLPLDLKPKHFPTPPSLADRAAIAIREAGGDPARYVDAVFRACWTEGLDIASAEVLSDKLKACGHDAEAILAAAESDAVKAVYARNTAEAVSLDVIGSPTYVLNGETFWGQDRLDLLEEALASGRPPYRAPG